MNTLDYILKKFKIYPNRKVPIEIRNTGRKDLANLFFELGFSCGVEVGVEAGLFSEVLCSSNPNLKLYCVDAWAYLPHRYWVPKRRIEKYFKEMLIRLAPFNVTIIKKLSMEAVNSFEDNFFDFVYIDADHRYEEVYKDICEWSKKVKSGGIVSGHDFISRKGDSTHNVKEAVFTYVKDFKIDPWFVLGSKNKAPDEFRDDSRSWMWVKP